MIIESLVPFGDSRESSHTNQSRSLSWSMLDHDGKEMSLTTSSDQNRFRMIISHDPNLMASDFYEENVTNNHALFHFHSVNIPQIKNNIRLHFEFQSVNDNVSYLFLYRYDRSPILNHVTQQYDGWSLFCSSSRALSSLSTHR